MPGHIELQGYGQLQYTNTLYPWDGRSCLRPPQVDWNDDPVGSYIKEFDLDESLRGQRVFIVQQPAKSADAAGGVAALAAASSQLAGELAAWVEQVAQ